MKQRSIMSRILIPSAIVLFLMPLLICGVFYWSAMKYAYGQASDEMDKMNENVQSLIDHYFSSDEQSNSRENVEHFLKQVSMQCRGNSGQADLIILSGEQHVIFPRNPADYPEVELIVRAISSDTDNTNHTMQQIITEDHVDYLVSSYEIRTPSPRLSQIITYCPSSQTGNWVQQASILVLLITIACSALLFLALWRTAHAITIPFWQLHNAFIHIGSGNYCTLDIPFALKEPESLRLTLNQMSEQLAKADQSQKSFFQNVSHELRNPLMSISGYAQGIEQDVFPDVKSAAHTILVESTRLTQMVNSILTLSRLDDSAYKINNQNISVNDAVCTSLDRVRGNAIDNGIHLEVNLPEQSRMIRCDGELLFNILDNLLSNAVRYARTQVSISVNYKNKHIIIQVADDGPGISQNDMPHIFERCYKGMGGKYGIGLSIAASSAKLLDARITADNLDKGGACFTLILPYPNRRG